MKPRPYTLLHPPDADLMKKDADYNDSTITRAACEQLNNINYQEQSDFDEENEEISRLTPVK
jgi:hypothetical protein